MSWRRYLRKSKVSGFSLAEVLITLAIMGIIAAFTIPPFFQMSANRASDRYTALSKDVAFMLLNAYERYKVEHSPDVTHVSISTLTPYMNYVNIDLSNASKVNGAPTGAWYSGNQSCGAQYVGNHICYNLHNGAVLWYCDLYYFGGVSSTNAIWANFDPDGSGPNPALQLWLTVDGHVYTAKTLPTTMTSGYIFSTVTQIPTTQDANWFTGF